jgi:hypothetical protein
MDYFMIRFAKKLFLLCIFITSYSTSALAACEPRDKPYEYEFCAYEPYQPDPLEFVTRIEVRPVGNESATLEKKYQACEEVGFKSVPPASRSTRSRGLGNAEVHAMNPVRQHDLNRHHNHEQPKPFRPRGYTKMQLNGDKAALTAALRDLEKELAQSWMPCFGIKRKIEKIKTILNSPATDYLSTIRSDNLALARAKIEHLGLGISQGLYKKNQWVYAITHQAAINIYVERCNQALIQEEDKRKQAALAHERTIALEAAAAQKLAAQKEIELAKQQLLVQAKKIVHPLERENAYDQIADLEACYHELFTSDIAYNPAPREVDQKIACEVSHEALIEDDDEQGATDRQALEQEKQALLKQAKRTIHPLERAQLCRQADAIEARIQALPQEAALLNSNRPIVIDGVIMLVDSALASNQYAYQCGPIMKHARQANFSVHAQADGKQKATGGAALEQEKQVLLKQAKRTIHPLERAQLCLQADAIEARIQALALEATAFNDSPPMVLLSGTILPINLNGLPALPAHESVDYNSDYAYQFDAIMTHACQASRAAHAEVDEKVAHEILGVNNNSPMVITDAIAPSVAPLRNDYEWKLLLSDAYLDSCAADPKFNHTIVDAVCEGLQEAGYAFATKALNPYEALETYKELGESMASLAKGAFYLTVGRDIYILSGGKYCMSDAELRENIYLVIDAIRKIDPHAFSAKQVGEFAGTEAAKMVHTFGLGKIISVVGKVNMARKARSLIKKLDKVTRVARSERAVAVTAEGFVVEAAHEARAGSLAQRGGNILKSEIGSGSGAGRAAGGALGEAASAAEVSEVFSLSFKECHDLVKYNKQDILDHLSKPLEELTRSGNQIRALHEKGFDLLHIFSDKHIKGHVLKINGMPKNVVDAAKSISIEMIDIVKKVDNCSLFTKGPNTIRTAINGTPVEIRLFIENNTLMKINLFVEHSDRIFENVIKI